MAVAPLSTGSLNALPFDQARLDHLMEEDGIDVLLVTSKHNVQYLLGGYKSNFFASMDGIGFSRYLPVLVYPKGRPEKAGYFAHRTEVWHKEIYPFWVPKMTADSSSSVTAIQSAIEHLEVSGIKTKRIGWESAFMPVDAADILRASFADSKFINIQPHLERMRAIKTPAEIAKLRIASERVIDTMLAVIGQHGAGATKLQIAEAVEREEINRGLTFDYVLIAMGSSLNRAASSQAWQPGDVLSLDSGGNYQGYIGDLARMAILGEPDAELEDMLSEVDEIQHVAFAPIKAGAEGRVVYEAAQEWISRSRYREHLYFLAHGMGLVSHEAPRIVPSGPLAAGGDHYGKHPLEPGMIISVETELRHPVRGFIKLEDTLVVTADGYEILGEGARGWNRGEAVSKAA